MCKIFALTSLAQVPVTPKLISVIKQATTKHDVHGFGYALVNNDGDLAGERTTKPREFKAMARAGKELGMVERLPIVERASNTFGHLEAALKGPKTLICHGRYSTNTQSLDNTHPFYNGDMALIHNGVVYDATGEMKGKTFTDNDTEILFRYWEEAKNSDEGVRAIEENISGYYAIANLDSKGLLHIVRDDRAPLYIAWVRTVKSYMIATTREIIKEVCQGMKWQADAAEPILNDVYAVFDGNEIVSHRDIFPLENAPTTKEFAAKASLALGKNAAPTTRFSSYTEEKWGENVDDYPLAKEIERRAELQALEEDEEEDYVKPLDFSNMRS